MECRVDGSMRASAASVDEFQFSVHEPLGFSVIVLYGALGSVPTPAGAQSDVASDSRLVVSSGQRPSGTVSVTRMLST